VGAPGGPGLQQRLDALPLPVFFVVVAVVGGLAGVVLDVLGDRTVDVAALAVRVVLFAGLLTWLAARQRRRGAGPGPAIGAGLRSGTLPAGADPAVWRPALEQQRRGAVRGRRLGPAVFGGLAVVSVVPAIVLGSVGWWLIAAAWGVLAVLSPLGSTRNVRRVDGLLGQLGDRPGRRPG
jgi:hypothetical protein